MKKQTAIQYLAEKLKYNAASNFDFAEHHTEILISTTEFESLIQHALAMERQQIIDAFFSGYNYEGGQLEEKSEQYYNETFTKTKND
jgi:hypothetical protein